MRVYLPQNAPSSRQHNRNINNSIGASEPSERVWMDRFFVWPCLIGGHQATNRHTLFSHFISNNIECLANEAAVQLPSHQRFVVSMRKWVCVCVCVLYFGKRPAPFGTTSTTTPASTSTQFLYHISYELNLVHYVLVHTAFVVRTHFPPHYNDFQIESNFCVCGWVCAVCWVFSSRSAPPKCMGV